MRMSKVPIESPGFGRAFLFSGTILAICGGRYSGCFPWVGVPAGSVPFAPALLRDPPACFCAVVEPPLHPLAAELRKPIWGLGAPETCRECGSWQWR
jgi:hypothetical protein